MVLKYGIGVDVSKKKLDVCFSLYEENLRVKIKSTRRFNNTIAGIRSLIRWIEKFRTDKSINFLVIIEATGVYHENLAFFLYAAGIPVSIVVPGRVKMYFKCKGIISKTDSIDAKGLACMAVELEHELWTPPSKEILELRSLVRCRSTLQKDLTKFKNRLHALANSFEPNKEAMRVLKNQMKHTKRQIAKIEKSISVLIELETDFTRKVKMIAGSIKGMSILSVLQIVAESNGFDLITSQSQLTSYAGYDVVENQSGSRAGKTRISKRGNSHIRHALHFPSLNVVRYELDVFSNLYERVYEATKIKMKGYVAVQRKLLCTVYALWKKNEAFDPKYINKSKNESQIRIEEIIAA